MNRKTRKCKCGKVVLTRAQIQEKRPIESLRDAGHVRQGGPVLGQGHVRAASLSDSVTGEWSMTVLEKDANYAIVEEEGASTTETDNFESMPTGPRPVLTKKSLVKELPVLIANRAHHTRA